MAEFDPVLAELSATGATAGMLLKAQERYVERCIAEVLNQIDEKIGKDLMTPDRALAFIYEIAGLRRVLNRQRQEAERNRHE